MNAFNGPEMSPPKTNPFSEVRVRDIIIWILGITILGVLIVVASAAITRSEPDLDSYTTVALYFVELGIICWILRQNQRAGVELNRLIGLKPDQFRYGKLIPLVLALYAIAFVSIVVLGSILLVLHFSPPWMNGDETGSTLADAPIIDRVIMGLILAPVLEELLFRGYFLHRFSAKWNQRTAIWVSSVMFALCHFDIIGTFFFALVACCLYLRTRSLIVPMVLHAIYNMIPTFLSILVDILSISSDKPQVPEVDTPEFIGAMVCLGTVALFICIPCAIYITRFIRDNWPESDRPLPYFASTEDTDREVYWRSGR